MLGYCCRRLQFLLPKCRNVGDIFQKEAIFVRSYSSESLLVAENDKPIDQGRSFTVSYLINSCGLSPKLALSASKKVQFDSRDGPDSVLNLLKEHGFTNAHISIVVRRFPNLLLVNARKTILPKFEFFGSVGISGTVLARVICDNPNIIRHHGLKRTIIPCYQIIQRLRLLDNFKVDRFFISLHRVTPTKVLSNTAPNVSLLRALKVPESSICYWVAFQPFLMSLESARFEEYVNKVIGMGFCPSLSKTFMKALVVISEVNASERAQRMETYRKLGWTEEDWLLAFRKNPLILMLSEKNFSSKMDFLVNSMGWQPADVAERPTALTYSLEKWIKPRCSVIRILLLKSLIVKEEVSLGPIVISGKQRFLDRFVIKYHELVPELLSIFQGKTGLAELGLGFEDRDDKLSELSTACSV